MLLSLIMGGAAIFAADNLLANPGFESLADGKPDRWQALVAVPQSSAAELSDTAHTGEHSVALRIPDNAPAQLQSVWKQDVIADLVGQRLSLTGYIKSENATGAALEIQCRRREPARMLATQSTSAAKTISGTDDWLQVSTEITVPKDADMISIRCVLTGPGAAWFDDIVLEQNEHAPIAAAMPEPPPRPPQQVSPLPADRDTEPPPQKEENSAAMLGNLDAAPAASPVADAKPAPGEPAPDASSVEEAQPPEEPAPRPGPTPEEIAAQTDERNRKLKETAEKLRDTHERANTNNLSLKREMEQFRDGLNAFQQQADQPGK